MRNATLGAILTAYFLKILEYTKATLDDGRLQEISMYYSFKIRRSNSRSIGATMYDAIRDCAVTLCASRLFIGGSFFERTLPWILDPLSSRHTLDVLVRVALLMTRSVTHLWRLRCHDWKCDARLSPQAIRALLALRAWRKGMALKASSCIIPWLRGEKGTRLRQRRL